MLAQDKPEQGTETLKFFNWPSETAAGLRLGCGWAADDLHYIPIPSVASDIRTQWKEKVKDASGKHLGISDRSERRVRRARVIPAAKIISREPPPIFLDTILG